MLVSDCSLLAPLATNSSRDERPKYMFRLVQLQLKDGMEERWKCWIEELKTTRLDEVRQSLKQNAVKQEVWFFDASNRTMNIFIDAENTQELRKTFVEGSSQLDQDHRREVKECFELEGRKDLDDVWLIFP